MSDLDHYCRECHHLTVSDGGQCQWCHSGNIGLSLPEHAEKAAQFYRGRRDYSSVAFRGEADVSQQIRYAEKFRLIKGFAILRGGDV